MKSLWASISLPRSVWYNSMVGPSWPRYKSYFVKIVANVSANSRLASAILQGEVSQRWIFR